MRGVSIAIRKRIGKSGKVSWLAQVYAGGKYAGCETFATKEEAKDWAASRRKAFERGWKARDASAPMGRVVDAWVGELPGMVSESTMKRDISIFHTHVPASVMDMKLKDVDTGDLQRVLNEVEGSLGTRKRVRIALQAFFAWCVRNKLLLESPAVGTVLPRGDTSGTEINPFTWPELDRAVTRMRAHSPALADAVLVLGYTGLRWGELRALRVRDIQRGETMTRLHVRASCSEGMKEKLPKGGRIRYVPVPPQVEPVLLRHVRGKGADDLVFTTARGNMLHKSNLRRGVHWDEIAPGRRLHDLRHTAATEWLRHGVDVVTVKMWLGHGSLSTTQKYVHYLGGEADLIALRKLSDGDDKDGSRMTFVHDIPTETQE